MYKVAVLVDLELSEKSGGHVKFWERIYEDLKSEKLDYKLEFFFLGNQNKKIKVNNYIILNIVKPLVSSKMLRLIGIDADATDLSPVNPILYRKLKKFDLIHTTDQLFSMSRTAKRVCKKFKIPLTTSLHTYAPSYSEFYVKKILNYLPFGLSSLFLEKFKIHKKIKSNQEKKIMNYFKCCKKILIDKTSSDQLFLKKFNKNNVIHIERGVNKKVFKKKKINKKDFLKKYNLPITSKIIFFCGRIHELKGALFLSKIHKSLISAKIKVATFLAGENFQGNECKKIGGENLIILDYLNEKEISKIMNLCDLFIFPSLYETGPQVILEAKSCQTVCIVSPSGGGRQIKKSGEDGIIINDYCVDVWFKVVLNLLKNKKKLDSIKKKLKNDNHLKSWKEIFFLRFDSSWKKLLGIK